MKKLIYTTLLFLFFVFFFSKATFAYYAFSDDFNDGNANDGIPLDWEEFAGPQGYWNVINGEYVGSVVKDGPDIFSYALAGDFSMSDYAFSLKIKGLQGVDKKIMFRYQSNGTRYDINILEGGGVALQKWLNSSSVALWWGGTTNSSQYNLKVEARQENIKIYVNDQNVIEVNDNLNPILTGKIGLQIWPGYYGGPGSRTTTAFDDVLVESLEPTPPPLQPLILLPGIGASWNHEDMMMDIEKQPEDWKMTPGVQVYDGLIETLKNVGYQLDENLFVYNYDWRKPISDAANDLGAYIQRHIPADTKFDLIGHSQGGLIARTYGQDSQNEDIDQIVTLGTPLHGALKPYYLWEGAELSKGLSGWQRIGAGIWLQYKKKGFDNKVETLQSTIPSFKDFLPDFPYLRENNTPKPLSQMIERNFWLEDLNNSIPPSLLGYLYNHVGQSGNTLRWIDIEERSKVDTLLGKWVDGKPKGAQYTLGDNTVLSESAQLAGATVKELPGLDHGDIVASENGQKAILETLGLPTNKTIVQSETDPLPALVLQIASPANMTVLNESFQPISEENIKLFVLPKAPSGIYHIRVFPEGDGGAYRLLVGNLTTDGDSWIEFSDQVTDPLHPKEHAINFTPDKTRLKSNLISLAGQRLFEAKNKTQLLNLPVKAVFRLLIETRLGKTERLQKNFSEKALEQTTISVLKLEDQIKVIPVFGQIEENKKTQILDLIREARDYLTQVEELL